MRKIKSFTIVELLIVMAIIAVILSLSIYGIGAVQRAQREALRQNDIKNIQTFIQNFYNQYQFYPVSCWNHPGTPIPDSTQYCLYFDGSLKEAKIIVNGGVIDTIKLNVGIPFRPEHVTTTPISTYTCSVDAESWQIIYRTPTGSTKPQTYGLAYCSEAGTSRNYGSYD